jgi:hypothetical protein
VFVKAAKRIHVLGVVCLAVGTIRRAVMTIPTHHDASRDGALRHDATKPRHEMNLAQRPAVGAVPTQ